MKTRKYHKIDQSPFFKLSSRSKLARVLGVNNQQLRHLARDAGKIYSSFEVPKASGGMRAVQNPRRDLKIVQARIARLLSRIAPPDYLFCPVKGRCYVSNAARHRDSRTVFCLDVKKYFPSTRAERVFWYFSKVMKCDSSIAGTLTRLAVLDGRLPTGSPLSPILAYCAHVDVWESIAAVCKREGYVLSVYIDDVTISGGSVSRSALWEIKKIIFRAGLRYHKEKRFVDGPAEITGVIVDKGRLSVPFRQRRKVRKLRELLRLGNDRSAEAKTLAGLKAQMMQIERTNNDLTT